MVATVAFVLNPVVAHAGSLDPFFGTWGGSGKVNFKDGRKEAIACRSYNTGRPAQLKVALRCASPAYKIEIRSTFDFKGNAISGTWEERTYNAQGAVVGRRTGDNIAVKVNGGGLSGAMTVSRRANNLSVRVQTTGIAMSGVNIALKRLRD